VVIATAAERHPAGKSGRETYQQAGLRKLTAEAKEAVRAEANSGRSLRNLAAAYGVSHETIRAVLRECRSNSSVATVG